MIKFLFQLPVKFLLWVGLIRREDDGSIRWPIHIAPRHCWVSAWEHPKLIGRWTGWFYVFRNLPGVIKWEEGRLLPRRWGFGILGLIEFGDRG